MEVDHLWLALVPAAAVVFAATAVWAMLARPRPPRDQPRLRNQAGPADEAANGPLPEATADLAAEVRAGAVPAAPPTRRRSFGTRLLACLAAGFIGAAASIAIGIAWIAGGAPGIWITTAVVTVLLVAAVWLKAAWRTSARQAVSATLVALLLGAATLGLLGQAVGIMHWYQVISGSMSPAIYGDYIEVPCRNCEYVIHVALGERPPRNAGIVCPNCVLTNGLPEEATVRTGDRIFAAAVREPRRWDVIVFANGDEETNTKRLIGLPGESVRLSGGDVFINDHRAVKDAAERPEMWDFVHDTRLMPRDPEAIVPRLWRALSDPSAWSTVEGGGWLCDAASEEGDVLFYDAPITAESSARVPGVALDLTPVADVWLRCRLTNFRGEGSLTLSWRRAESQVRATFTPRGEVTLTAHDGQTGGMPRQATADLRLPAEVGLMIRDGAAHVVVDGRVVASQPFLPDDLDSARQWARRNYAPPLLTLEARECSAAVESIRIFRDAHYTRMGGRRDLFAMRESLQLGPAEMFVLGDNSANSEDSRVYGPVGVDQYVGIVWGRYLPPSRTRWFGEK